MSNNPNYLILYEGLKIFRDAMLSFIIAKLKQIYGDDWWNKGIAPCFDSERLGEIQTLFEKRDSSLVIQRPGGELAEVLDIGNFGIIIGKKQNWSNVFRDVFDDRNKSRVLGWLEEIREVRNPVAHPQTGDLLIDDVFRGLDNADRILRLIKSDVAVEIQRLKRLLVSKKEDKPPVIPFNIPFILPQLDTPNFMGRNEELKCLKESLLEREASTSSKTFCLIGPGGIGKSALACHFAMLHQGDFPDGVIGLRVDGKDADAVAREFARSYGEEILPEDKRNAAAIMQSLFAPRQVLLIFDNADDVDSSVIRQLRPGGNQCAIIITTRDRSLPDLLNIPPENTLNLPSLSPQDSALLLEKFVGQDRLAAEPIAAQEIVKLTENLPLALQIVGANLKMRAQVSLANYVISLRDEKSRLSKLQVRGDKDLNLQATFELSLKMLDNAEVDFLACLSVCAQNGFSVQAAMAAASYDRETTEERLDYLNHLSLLEKARLDRFIFHPLIRLFARELAIERGVQNIATRQHARFFIEFIKPTAIKDLTVNSFIIAELDSIILAAEWLQSRAGTSNEFTEHEAVWLDTLGALFQRQGRLNEAHNAIQQSIQIGEKLGNDRHVAMALNNLGIALQNQGKFTEAINYLQRSLSIREKLGNQRDIAITLNSLGTAFRHQGRPDEAIKLLQRSLKIREQLGDQRDIAIILNSLGDVCIELGHLDQAIVDFQHSLQISEKLGDEPQIAVSLNSLSEVLQKQKRFDEAISYLQRSIQMGDERQQARSYHLLGDTYRSKGEYRKASENLKHSYDLYIKLGDEKGQAWVLQSAGINHREKGQLKGSEDRLQQSYELYKRLNDQKGQAVVLNILGGVYLKQDKMDEASAAFLRSFELDSETGNQSGQAKVLYNLGFAFQKKGDLGKAIDHFRRSLSIDKRLGNKLGEAKMLLTLGKVLLHIGDVEQAVTHFRESLEINRSLKDFDGVGMAASELINALIKLGRRDEALNYCQQALTIDPDNRRLLSLCRQLSR